MKLVRTLLLPLFLVTGCAASEAREEVTVAASDVVASAPDHQHFGKVSQEEQEASIEHFVVRNPSFALDRESVQVDELTGGLSNAYNRTPLGPPVTLTSAEAVKKALAFVERNLDVLHLTANDLATADVEAKPYPFETGAYPWTVTFRRISKTPGYEAFETANRHVAVSVDFSKDGTIGRIFNSSSFFPGLAITTTPALVGDDPALVKSIVGRELVWRDPSFVPGPDVYLGRATTDDIASKTPVMHLEYDASGFTMTLAYEVVVVRRGYTFTFTVHNATGRILELEQGFSF